MVAAESEANGRNRRKDMSIVGILRANEIYRRDDKSAARDITCM